MTEKICKICLTLINKEDDYYKIEGYRKGKKDGTLFYHKNCYMERISGKKEQLMALKGAMHVLSKANKKLNVIGE